MPFFPVVIEDTSPMLAFSPTDWRAGVSGDSQLDHQSSYLLTQTDGATISLDFYGSSVQIFGSKRSYHGEYKVQLDKNPYQSFSGLSYTELFQQSLFSANFTLGDHEVRISNQNITFTDVDYITFQTSAGKENETLIVNTFEDGHPSFKYAPSSSWKTPDKAGTFIGSTGHYRALTHPSATTDPLASANFTFHVIILIYWISFLIDCFLISKGDAVALYGPVGPNSCTAYSIKVDNGNPSLFTSSRQFYKPQQILFYAGNLGVGQHILQIQLPGSSSSGEFAIDFATVYTTPSLGGRDLIIGIAVSAGIAAIMILACVYLFWRRSKNKVKITKDEALQQHSRLVSPFTSLPSAQSTSLSAAESQSPSQPLMHPPGLSKQRSKFDLNALHQGQTPTTSHRRAETSTSGSESVIQVIQQAEAPESRIPADTSISPPQYTLSPDNPRNIDHART
ncbi:LOW QUALITY PROTEIN: hypothetical protein CVT25_015877 [Psilocybe cyanescens]|uniref:Uncharacterized protein n=1 Tax=Psilocybe cyanescens TaxID=93625 RepID=A0A409XIG7_PSICY|nr:LOW QUALITY PROTEIN: hypothetical protein CVT25_015877 [Psilocybe cyanescens]